MKLLLQHMLQENGKNIFMTKITKQSTKLPNLICEWGLFYLFTKVKKKKKE